MLPNLKVDLVGARWASRQHCYLISIIGDADVVAVFDIGPSNRVSLVGDLYASPVQSLNELLAADIDTVIVTTSSGVHSESIVRALQSNKAVFVEKPVSQGIGDAWKIVVPPKDIGLPARLIPVARFG